MAFACYTNERGLIGVFGTREQAETRNFGPMYAPNVVEISDDHTSVPVPKRGVFFHHHDQSYPDLVAELCAVHAE